ncbi:hypothetical protein LZF95_15025 [Algoriphagus sp. AGSA1]|uniref:hypothetical protein n=1 Tax=Algoriphagus sp. AGSA1 TaxID=2907213 RepID=UPI001F35AAE6|nr:hypothetical protein [Algoriphagus sp. AGSA1]MCE7055992.1 hypothetical protein [Algoriphagus sp. AGSA1]
MEGVKQSQKEPFIPRIGNEGLELARWIHSMMVKHKNFRYEIELVEGDTQRDDYFPGEIPSAGRQV